MGRTLSFRYQMELDFSDEVHQHQFTLRMLPHTDERQLVIMSGIEVSPLCHIREDVDAFGNRYVYGTIEQCHNRFCVDVSGLADISAGAFEKAGECEYIYRYQSDYTRQGICLKDFSDKMVRPVDEDDRAYALRIMHGVYDRMEYKKCVTTIDTTAEQALLLGAGVCQDYAHIMVSVLRKAGIPARYAVGMMLGEGYSHAWAEGLIDGVWMGFDPTNNHAVDDTYIKISSGRDYQDCIVNRGFFYGNVTQEQRVNVLVSEVQ